MKKLVISLLTIVAAIFAGPLCAQEKRIALTYDDAPRNDAFLQGEARAQILIDGLAQAGVEQAAFFVTTQGINSPARLQRIQSYAAAGHVIANHTHSHPWLRDVSVEAYLADIDIAETMLAVFDNRRPWFRYPYLNEAPNVLKRNAVRKGLADRGLENGYVTVDTYDWYLESLFQKAKRGDKPVCIGALGRLYTDMMVDAANFYDRAARDYLDAVPAHTLLLHENDIAALFITDLVAALEADGWEIITADEAYEDPIFDIEPETNFLGMGRVAALTALAGKPKKEFTFLAVEEALIDQAFIDYGIVGECSE